MADQQTPPEQELSFAEKKKRAKAEKQARRAAEKGTTEEGGPVGLQKDGTPAKSESKAQKQQDPSGAGVSEAKAKAGKQQSQQKVQQRSGEQQGKQQSSSHPDMPTRRRPSQGATVKPQVKKDNKQVELFSHLYTPRRYTIEGVSKDVHPSVLAVGIQISNYEICGSSARCVAMLLAFKDAIQEYTTPSGTSLARHMTSHHLSPQIDYLKSCRPISESMGNAIRWLKKLIVEIDPSFPEQEAKDYLCKSIDRFIQERITVADQAIADSASKHIKDGSVVLAYGKSSIVETTILQAQADGTSFRVVVVDSRPLFEGKVLATSLMKAGLQVAYYPFSGLARAVSDATLALLGAHSMLSNGRLQSRIGTASVAMRAHKADVPVIVCCESVKFSGKVALDSIISNEVAPAEELLLQPVATPTLNTTGSAKAEVTEKTQPPSLGDWRDIPNLKILNLMYDVTPAEYITTVICEYGSLPSTSVPVVHRLVNEGISI